ncbi:MAG TPA: ATP-binding cassette domain-containing protein [Brevundimonas sp.]|uniref:ABC-F family ATP-binding cassette domain-containing protein n=1 Tax=Brevundimonas sp. TaxID=1871086 RepID=UPI002CCE9EE8|nr:ATP-binding cassette domain-containing protein [Brevundimonas sp.]HRH20308.1 ATP-binding cassette domain-containing protein [Brevundimonas sp.]
MARAPLVSLRDVRLQDGPLPLFDGVDLAIEPGQHACLVGRNGAGKSTLMKLVMGLIDADSGERAVQAGARFSYVPQEPVIVGPTLRDHATSGGADPWAADQWLETFGLDPEKPATRLSGGETRRADLARAFAEQPDLLLLDEPTNHLDILAIETLEDELKAARFAVLMVSHDRTFLERTTKRCLWLENRRVRTLDKGFKAFDAWAAKVTEEEAESLRRLTKEIERETYTFYRSITAQRTRNEGRARRLDALRQDRARRVADLPRDIQLGVDSGPTSGKLVAELKGVAKGFGDRTILKPFSTKVLRGDRLAIVGPNGAGKTTLVRLLLGEIEADAGSIRLGANLQPVYLDQARADLRSDMTLWDALTPGGGDSILVRGQSKHVAAYAKDFLFKESQLRQPVSTLSGGERNRLLLARALAQPANLLILDEPTNDLDMETLDRLEDLLEDYDGTLILVSHDRDFIDRLATSTIALNGRGDAVETPGGWTDFVAQNPGFLSAADTSPPLQSGGGGPRRGGGGERPAPAQPARKLSYKDARRLEEAEREMESLPAAIETLETALADPALYTTDRKRFDKLSADLDATRARLEAAETDWLRIEEMKATLTA